jgi:spore maturation protein CgeB
MLHERTPELLSIFTENISVACFDSPEELATAIPRWLSDGKRRHSIANAGHDLVYAAHSWDHRISELLTRADLVRDS